jgi:hypothetical protein
MGLPKHNGFKRLAGQAADQHGATLRTGGHGTATLAIGVAQQLVGNRSQQQRVLKSLAEQFQAGMATTQIAQRPGHQARVLQGIFIGLAVAIGQIRPDAWRQNFLGPAAVVGNALRRYVSAGAWLAAIRHAFNFAPSAATGCGKCR